MTLEILIATMHQQDFSLIDKVNIQSNAIVVNQCNQYSYQEIKKDQYRIKWFNVNERGLSRSRNLALSKATADICLLVDDDEILHDDYEKVLIDEFTNNKKADLITFNLNSIGNISKRYVNKDRHRLNVFTIMRYGSARIAFRRNKVLNARILFAPNFGAGTDISSGEDSLFLHDCLDKGLKAFTSPEVIADINDVRENSSWFKGYTEKYFVNMGTIYSAMSPRFSTLWIIQYIIRHRDTTKDLGFFNCLKLMFKGKSKKID